MIVFEAVVTNGIDTINDAEYFWDFDNGTLNGINKDSVTHVYENGGGYRVKLKVVKDANSWDTIQPIRIAMKPDYSKTKLNLPEEQDGICLGSYAPLIGKAVPEIWEDEPIYEVVETPYDYFEFDDDYTSNITFDEFKNNETFTSGDIDSIGLKILHADMGDLKIKLSCENGNSVILKDFDATNHLLLGDTATNEAYQYYWSASASATMNSITTNANNIIPASAYLPNQTFDNLIGCKLNGKWTIDIIDNQELDSGFIYSWNIAYKEDVLPDVWTFKDTLLQYKEVNNVLYGTYWSGTNAGASSATKIGDTIASYTNVKPETYGNNKYVFHVINNWGCPQDTFTMVNVEEVSFTAAPEGGEAKLDVDFENTTTWASEKEWEFGDKSAKELRIESDTISHKYLEKGDYDAILIVTDENGCTDTDTITINVTVEPFKIENIPNMFSPSKDDINEVYKFSEENLKGIKEFELYIYNRWGEKVYETTSVEEAINKGWDGKNLLGLRCAPGIYFYVIKAKAKDPDYKYDEEGKKNRFEERGTIHLFRGK